VSDSITRVKRSRPNLASYVAEKERVIFYCKGDKKWYVKELKNQKEDSQATILDQAGITKGASFRTRKEAVEATCAALGLESISFRYSHRPGNWVSEDRLFRFASFREAKNRLWYVGLTQKGGEHFSVTQADEDGWLKVLGLHQDFKTLKAAREAISNMEISEAQSV
jgi:hypothetical protein